MFVYSLQGLDLTGDAEGLRLKAYQDTGGVWTIGYGHTGKDVYPGLVITRERALELLAQDVTEASAAVNRLVTWPKLTQEMFDALVDFTFNVGTTAFKTSTLLRKLNAGEIEEAASELRRWNKDNGRVIPGLSKRRNQERALFLLGADFS